MGTLKLSDAFNELDYVLILIADDILLLERIVDKIDYTIVLPLIAFEIGALKMMLY